MDVQKNLAQVEQLLKRGKSEEAAQKLEEILEADSQNEVVANKLALVYVDLEQKSKAVAVYCTIAKRASEKAKNQKALALYKQALVIDASDPRVLLGMAEESEQLGKFSDAIRYNEELINYFRPRKRYIDIIGACSRLVRCDPQNEVARLVWLDIVRVLGDEAKLIQALVTLSGPPGVASAEQKVGGDPRLITQKVLDSLVALLDWFPSDPILPYSLAWVAYRNQDKKTAYSFLAEAYRRDPDYCLSLLLFARLLVEEERLAESQFIFKQCRESVGKDKRTNIKVLTEQISNFEKSNGWMAFSEGLSLGQDLNAVDFVRKLKNLPTETDKQKEKEAEEKTLRQSYGSPTTPEREIVIGGLEPSSEAADQENTSAFELTSMISLTPEELDQRTMAKPAEKTGKKSPNEISAVDLPAPDTAGEENIIESNNDQFNQELMNIIPAQEVGQTVSKVEDQTQPSITATQVFSPQDYVNASKWEHAIRVEVDQATVQQAKQAKDAIEAQKAKDVKKLLQEEAGGERRTSIPAIISQIVRPKIKLDESDTSSAINLPNADKPAFVGIPEVPKPVPPTEVRNEDAEPTIFFRKPKIGNFLEDSEPTIIKAASPKTLQPEAEFAPAPEASNLLELDSGQAVTNLIDTENVGDNEKTLIHQPLKPFQIDKQEIAKKIDQKATEILGVEQSVPEAKIETEDVTTVFRPPARPDATHTPPPLSPIPESPEVSIQLGADKTVDLGTDLLEVKPEPGVAKEVSPTKEFLKQIENTTINVDKLIQLADNYFKAGQFYLARKSYREALAGGANEQLIKNKLAEIRKLEFPDSVYRRISSDDVSVTSAADVQKIISDLEKDFDIDFSDALPDIEFQKSARLLRQKIEQQVENCDVKIRIDLGVAFYEMGFLEEAENQFLTASEQDPTVRFDAYYLAGQTMFARKNYKRAIEMLVELLREKQRPELENVAVYYLLGELFAATNDKANAKSYFDRVAKINSNYRNVKEKIRS